ncbi:hypothetical protein [Serpens gallinarum]|uniref:Uncharacterized protein n=1 Tax=Serpens gallinarum TaxID=2763075 RepID=A0ABR8TPK5_9PSED|nr:hypothetical protein [Serpens gallinarum]MBD7977681.1 hypothetical protein [Serpens gallinarum]
MTYLIDAWLDRPQPYLHIVDCRTGAVCARFDASDLEELREQGELDPTVLNSSEPAVLKELIRTLFLFCYARALRPSHGGLLT